MDRLPESLSDCMDFMRNVCDLLKSDLAATPLTRAHAEVHGLIDQLELMIPDLLSKHERMTEVCAQGEQEIQQKVATAQDTLNRGLAIQDGQVSQEEILKLQQQAFGLKFTPPPVPEMPSGWSSVLALELVSNATPQIALPVLPTVSNAWSDWQMDATS